MLERILTNRSKWFLRYFVLLTFLWWVLTEGLMFQWWFGVITIIIATSVTYFVTRNDLVHFPIRLRAFIPFIPYFFYQSYRGGIGVAWAAFSPQRILKPFYTTFKLSIPDDHALARFSFAACMCLLPGTLSCRINGDDLHIHVLDTGMYKIEDMRRMERLVARIFSIELS